MVKRRDGMAADLQPLHLHLPAYA